MKNIVKGLPVVMHRAAVAILCCQIAVPLPLVAQTSSLPSPVDRWGKSDGSYITSINNSALDQFIQEELPRLKEEGVVSGDAYLEMTDAGNTLVINQGTVRVLLDWDSFNIGADNSVKFVQPSTSSLALNRIDQQAPSVILGKLEANGAVWLLNTNGILFGDGAQVNTSGLIAAAMEYNGLELDKALTEQDLEKFQTGALFDAINNDAPFLINAQDLVAGSNDVPQVVLTSKASIKSSNGGTVLLAAPEVINEGSVMADGGQVVLAGTKKDLYLALTNPKNTRLRGYIVEVNSGDTATVSVNVAREGEPELIEQFVVTRGAGEVTVKGSNDNKVKISAPEKGGVINAGTLRSNLGNVTLVAKDIVQAGQIQSSTAVDVNGSIRLMARDGASVVDRSIDASKRLFLDTDSAMSDTLPSKVAIGTDTGQVFFKPDSRTHIDIVSDKTATANSSLEQPKSEIIVQGNHVVMEAGANVVAPSAKVIIEARPDASTAFQSAPNFSGESQFVMEEGALIDVSGTEDSSVDASRNFIEVFVTSDELKDSPELKDGELLRAELYVDIRRDTQLFSIAPFLEGVKKTASERNTAGGSVDILATGGVKMADGAVIDVSGGKTHYEAGLVRSSLLMGSRGLVDISNANHKDPALKLFNTGPLSGNTATHKRWGKTDSFRPGPSNNVRVYNREAYDQWDNAGSISMRSANMDISAGAELLAATRQGQYQTAASASPKGGNISLDMGDAETDIMVLAQRNAEDVVDGLRMGRLQLLAEQLQKSGASDISLRSAGDISVADDTTLKLTDQSRLALKGRNIEMAGDIAIAGGKVELVQGEFEQQGTLLVTGDIDVSGNWTNDSPPGGGAAVEPAVAVVDGGTITLQTGSLSHLEVDNQVALKANAGAWRNTEGKITMGDAGSINLAIDDTGTMSLAGSYQALDAGKGGKLSITAKNVTLTDSNTEADNPNVLTEDLVISNSFFANTDVGQFSFSSNGGDVTVTENAHIDLSHRSLQLTEQAATLKTDTDTNQVLEAVALPSYLQAAGKLSLNAKINEETQLQQGFGNLSIAAGSKITGPAGSEISLEANNSIWMDGTVDIIGGLFEATLSYASGKTPGEKSDQNNYVVLGQQAKLNLAAGAVIIPQSSSTISENRLYHAGRVNLTAEYGSIATLKGSQINLSGAVVTQTIAPKDFSGQPRDVTTSLNAGSFTVQAEKGLLVAGDITFDSAASDYRGGDIKLTLNPNSFNRGLLSDAPPVNFIIGSNTDDAMLSALSDFSRGDKLNSELKGLGWIRGDLLDGTSSGAMRNLTLDIDHTIPSPQGTETLKFNRIAVDGDATIAALGSITLDTAWLDLSAGNLAVNAKRVSLGENNRNNNGQLQYQPLSGNGDLPSGIELADIAAGNGRLNVVSNTIDLRGSITISGAEQSTLAASSSVRVLPLQSSGFGDQIAPASLTSFGQLNIETPLLWGATAAQYRIDIQGDNSQLNINGYFDTAQNRYLSNDMSLLSVSSKLSFSAETIAVDTNIVAPQGQLTFDAQRALQLKSNSKLSVALVTNTPFGRILGKDVVWTYPINEAGSPQVINRFNEKLITLKSPSIVADAGSVQDLSGGGSIYGTEFIAGLGGSVDILANRNYQELFVLVPSQVGTAGAYDVLEFGGSDIPFGMQFELAGSGVIADGVYTVMPASYALLPGAVMVQPSNIDQPLYGPGFRSSTVYGADVVSGRFIGAGDRGNGGWDTFIVEPGTAVLKRANYQITTVDKFEKFTDSQPGTKASDNGRLLVNAGETLNFAGQLLSNSDSKVGVSMDVVSSGTLVIGSNPVANAVVIDPSLFTGSGADSILVGAERVWQDGSWSYNAVADSMTVDSVTLNSQELLLTAKNTITINNSQLNNTAAASFGGNQWLTSSGVSLLTSTAKGSSLVLDKITDFDGRLIIDDNSQVRASGAMAVSYNGDDVLRGLEVNQGRLQLASDDLTIGNTGSVKGSLLELASSVELYAEKSIQFVSDLTANLREVILTAGNLQVADGSTVSIKSDSTVTLQGTKDSVAAANSNGNLTIAASIIQWLGGEDTSNKLALSANQINLKASEMIATGELDVSGAGGLRLDTPILTSSDSAELRLLTAGDLVLVNTGATANSSGYAGSTFSLQGDNVTVDTVISAQSGLIDIAATGGDVNFGSSALLDVSPITTTFSANAVKQGPAGIINTRATGDINVADLAGFYFGTQDSSDGQLSLRSRGQLSLNGNGTWGSGLDLKVEAGSLSSVNDWNALVAMNNAGFSDMVDISITDTNQSLTLASGQRLQANDISLATTGSLNIDGEIIANKASKAVTLVGEQGVAVNNSASVTLKAKDSKKPASLKLQATAGAVTVEDAARVNIDGSLVVVKAATDANTRIALGGNDSIGNADNGSNVIDVYAYTSVNDNAVDQAEMEAYANQAIAAAASTVFNINSVYAVTVKPWLDITSTTDLVLHENDAGAKDNPLIENQINLNKLRTANGDAGWLSLRAAGDVVLTSGLTGGVDYVKDSDYGAAAIAMENDSWSMSVVAGANTNYQLQRAEILRDSDLRLGTKSFIRTGTGDINISVAGDLELAEGAAIYTVGKTKYQVNTSNAWDEVVPGNSTRKNALPATGELDWRWAAKLMGTFSGFTTDAGDVDIDVDGELRSLGELQTPNSFTLVAATNKVENREGRFDDDMRAWGFSIREIEGGIHSIGGGDLRVNVGGDITNTSFSTPGAADGLYTDLNPATDLIRYEGGDLSVTSLGDIRRATFSSDDGDILVRALGDIGALADQKGSILITGSNFNASVTSGGDLTFDGSANSLMMSRIEGEGVNPYARDADERPGGADEKLQRYNDYRLTQEEVGGYFYDGYNTSSIDLTSVGGDLLYSGDKDRVKGLMATDVAGNSFESTVTSYQILPAKVSFKSLSGDVLLGDSLTVYPDKNASLEILAAGNVAAKDNPKDTSDRLWNIYLPDLVASSIVPTINNYIDISSGDPSSRLVDLFYDAFKTPQDLHSAQLIDRSDVEPVRIIARTGDFGGGTRNISLQLPLAADIYAGGDIVNVDMNIQHNRATDVSQIRAGGSILYPISLQTGTAKLKKESIGIDIAGPGDLLVMAGDKIDLGGSKGISSIGTVKNPALPNRGVGLHVYAGLSEIPKANAVLGNSISSNASIAGLANPSISTVDWLSTTAAAENNSDTFNRALINSVASVSGERPEDEKQALTSWQQLKSFDQLRVATQVLKDVVLADPGFVVANGQYLFAEAPVGTKAFASQQDRTEAFNAYWDVVANVVGLSYLLENNAQAIDGLSLDDPASVTVFNQLSVAQQLQAGFAGVKQLDAPRQLFVAEAIVNEQIAQSSLEVVQPNVPLQLVNFERAYIALRRFYGDQFNFTLKAMEDKVAELLNADQSSFELVFGTRNNSELQSFEDVLAVWAADSGDSFSVAKDKPVNKGDISLQFSTIKSNAGGDLNLYSPYGAVDVGLAAAQLEQLELKKTSDELGILSFAGGDINAIIGGDININESRVFNLGGGEVRLMSSFANIDAGRGASSTVITPPPVFSFDPNTGAISVSNNPPTSGSGIRTAANASVYLATPMGIVDAGEAGIDSGGDLFIAAGEVIGADRISVGGVSVGVPTVVPVSVASIDASSAAGAATDSAQSDAGASAAASSAQATAFVYITLLDTGTE